jgi:hypothetical protein
MSVMNFSDLIEVYRATDPSLIAQAKHILAAERISCIAHGERHAEEATFPVTFLVPSHLADRARATLARV